MKKMSIRWFVFLAAIGLFAAPPTQARTDDREAQPEGLQPGPFAIGFRVLEKVDGSRATGPKRDFTGALQPETSALPVPISVWYPARPRTGEPFEYGIYLALDRTHKRGSFGPITDADRAEAADWLDRLSRIGLQRPLADGEREAILRRPVAARRDAVAADGRFPLVLAGLYGTQAANMLAEHLASHGYVVATGPMSPKVSTRQFPAPQLAIETQTRNLELILARVREMPFVDPLRLGLLGVNFDGFGVLNVQMRNMQADVVISLDGWEGKARGAEVMTESPYFDPVRLRVPYLLFTMDATDDDPQHDPDPALFDRLLYSERSFYAIDGVTHPYYIGDLLAWPHLEDEVAPSYGFLYGTVRRWLDAYVKEDSKARHRIERRAAGDGFGEIDLAFERHGDALPPAPTREEFVELMETDVERAERILRGALAANPSVELVSMPTLQQLALRARQREAWDEAAAVNRIKTTAFPGSTQAWFDLGNALREASRPGEAAEAYREALQVLADDPSVAAAEREATRRQVLDRLGTVVPSQGRF